MADPRTLLESTANYIFPNTPEIQGKVPLWMRFYVYAYPSTAGGRFAAQQRMAGSEDILGSGVSVLSTPLTKQLANIVIPAQISFISTTGLPYQNKTTVAENFLPSLFGLGSLLNLKNFAVQGLAKQATRIFQDFAASQFGFGEPVDVSQRMLSDLTFAGGGSYRQFSISVYLPCFFENDSIAAAEITKAFEAYCLPTATSAGSASSTKFYHPPVWVMGTSSSLDRLAYDSDWCGYPQLSVLTTVKTKRVPLETSTLSGIGPNIKPMVYTISLVFQELEPALRIVAPGVPGIFSRPSGTRITNRSSTVSAGFGQTIGII